MPSFGLGPKDSTWTIPADLAVAISTVPVAFQITRSQAMYYHACISCSSKFFSPKQENGCPRCGGLVMAEERHEKPWDNVKTASELEAEREVEQRILQRKYAEQQARLACPGCGESPFIG
jgi:DNA-directed RNA polymerase subunit RPC12/RpoP